MLKKFFFSLVMLPLLAMSMTSCDNDDEDILNTKLVRGQWDVVDRDVDDDKFMVYDFETKSDLTWSWGTLTTFHFRIPDMTVIYEVEYDFHISDPVNTKGNVTVDLTPVADLDAEDPTVNTVVYRIDELTSKEMRWTLISGTGEKTMKFRRRAD